MRGRRRRDCLEGCRVSQITTLSGLVGEGPFFKFWEGDGQFHVYSCELIATEGREVTLSPVGKMTDHHHWLGHILEYNSN